MATGQIALSNTINITLASAPSGLKEYSTNSIVLLTNEQPLSSEPYIWAVNAQDVINEYGSDSLTAKMAQLEGNVNPLLPPKPMNKTKLKQFTPPKNQFKKDDT